MNLLIFFIDSIGRHCPGFAFGLAQNGLTAPSGLPLTCLITPFSCMLATSLSSTACPSGSVCGFFKFKGSFGLPIQSILKPLSTTLAAKLLSGVIIFQFSLANLILPPTGILFSRSTSMQIPVFSTISTAFWSLRARTSIGGSSNSWQVRSV